MYHQIAESIAQRKQAEKDLQISYTKIENYSNLLNSELEKGREIQLNFLPSRENLWQISLENQWEFSAFFRPARQVAGDFYDVFSLPHDSLGIVIADVCDKGVGAALFMALFRSLIRVFSRASKMKGTASNLLKIYQPKGGWLGTSAVVNLAHLNALLAISQTNDYVASNHGMLGMFATMFFGVLELKTGLLTYINAGHEPIFVLAPREGIRKILTANSPAVGMMPKIQFQLEQSWLQPQEILVGFTDGITDARALDGSFFTLERLRQLLQSPFSHAAELIELISQAVLTHTEGAEQFDDITLLAVQNSSPRKLYNKLTSDDSRTLWLPPT
jgi:serine phosphatase RsbU (regulator of sigma subunit)